MNMNTVSLPAGLAGDHLQLDSDPCSIVPVYVCAWLITSPASVGVTTWGWNKKKYTKEYAALHTIQQTLFDRGKHPVPAQVGIVDLVPTYLDKELLQIKMYWN